MNTNVLPVMLVKRIPYKKNAGTTIIPISPPYYPNN